MFTEALSLVMDHELLTDKPRFSFFRKNLKRFPEEAEVFLVNRIQVNLNSTGNRYYAAIAESLDLKSRVNPGRTSAIAEEIRTNFKRRRNLIQLLHVF